MMELSDALLLSGHAGSSSEIAFLQVGERRVSACAAASSEATALILLQDPFNSTNEDN